MSLLMTSSNMRSKFCREKSYTFVHYLLSKYGDGMFSLFEIIYSSSRRILSVGLRQDCQYFYQVKIIYLFFSPIGNFPKVL